MAASSQSSLKVGMSLRTSVQPASPFGPQSEAKSEKIISYELGVKAQLLDRRVQVDFDVYDYEVKDQAKVRHILIAVPPTADAKADAAAKAKAEVIRMAARPMVAINV